jgi:hypothetical protein
MREGALIPRDEAKEMYNLEDILDLCLLVEMYCTIHSGRRVFST